MDAGSFLATFLILFREALEASLIVGIILTVLARLNQKKYFTHVYISVFAALAISYFAGVGLMSLTEAAQDNIGKMIEGFVSLLACGILTYMVFWMDTQSKRIKPEIEVQLETAISKKEYLTILTLPFFSIFREGAETVLFLGALSAKNPDGISWLGAFSGFALAVGIAALIFVGGKRVPLKPLFQSSGLLLLFIAAGLLAYGIHELQEIRIIPEFIYPIWNINHIVNEKEGVGSFLKALFGYNGNPSLLEVLSYGAYLIGIFWLLKNRAIQIPAK